MSKCGCKKGFGILEVIVASLVLAFMFLALNVLQKGNRESILRVRARDAANIVAQEIIDSISALGSASVQAGIRACNSGDDENRDLCRTRFFTGSTTRRIQDTMSIAMPCSAVVEVRNASDLEGVVIEDQTHYLKAASGGTSDNLSVKHQFAKQIDITVYWKFKNTDQSINMSSLIR